MTFYNLAREYTTTTGTGTVTLTGAVPGMLTWDLAGVPNAATVSYSIITYDTTTHRPTGAECGSGTYTTSGATLARTTVEDSTSAGAKITLTGLSEVFITPLASDFAGFTPVGGSAPFAIYENGTLSANAVTNTTTQNPMPLATEVIDADGLFTLAGDTLTCAVAGMYDVEVSTYVVDSNNFGNGIFYMFVDSDSTEVGPNNWPYTAIETTLTSAKTEIAFTFSGPIALGVGDTLTIGIENQTGGTINPDVTELRITRLGDA